MKANTAIYILGIIYAMMCAYSALHGLRVVYDNAPLFEESFAVLIAMPLAFRDCVFTLLLLWLISATEKC